jgi:hypothetical protein
MLLVRPMGCTSFLEIKFVPLHLKIDIYEKIVFNFRGNSLCSNSL